MERQEREARKPESIVMASHATIGAPFRTLALARGGSYDPDRCRDASRSRHARSRRLPLAETGRAVGPVLRVPEWDQPGRRSCAVGAGSRRVRAARSARPQGDVHRERACDGSRADVVRRLPARVFRRHHAAGRVAPPELLHGPRRDGPPGDAGHWHRRCDDEEQREVRLELAGLARRATRLLGLARATEGARQGRAGRDREDRRGRARQGVQHLELRPRRRPRVLLLEADVVLGLDDARPGEFNIWNFDLGDDREFYCSKLMWYSVWTTLGLALDDMPWTTRLVWFSPKQLMHSPHVDVLFSPGNY